MHSNEPDDLDKRIESAVAAAMEKRALEEAAEMARISAAFQPEFRIASEVKTLRDELAMAAPAEEIYWLLDVGEQKDVAKVAAARYEYADAMLEARK
jgi:hypothetical protein